MNKLKQLLFLGTLVFAFTFATMQNVEAQNLVRYEVSGNSSIQAPFTLNQINIKRGDNQLVLYLPKFGASTRTRPDGVEVQAVAVKDKPDTYRVSKIQSIWDCQKAGKLTECGNMPIPQNGFVLSASGTKKDFLYTQFFEGSVFQLKTQYEYETSYGLNVVNPTEDNNPSGRGFPGFRGPNQLNVYTVDYPEKNTGTNEFGYEVTVCGGRVIGKEGANSFIRDSADCFILSGHGAAAKWLHENAFEGANIAYTETPEPKVIASVDSETYFHQLKQLADEMDMLTKGNMPESITQKISTLEIQKNTRPRNEVLSDALQLFDEMEQTYWSSFPTSFSQGVRGVWHRPSENTTTAIQNVIARYKANGINTIFLETYLHGDPIFQSQTFSQYEIQQRLPFGLVDGQFDPLTTWLTEAHKQGLKVNVWFQTFYAGNINAGNKTRGGILESHPDWVNIQKSGMDGDPLPPSNLEPGAYFLDPANPEVQTFLLTFIDEIVTRYPVDGFQLDYIRYPSALPTDRAGFSDSTWGYTPYARKEFAHQYAELMAEKLLGRDINNADELIARLAKNDKDKFVKKDKTTIVEELAAFYDPVLINLKEDRRAWDAWNQYKTGKVDNFVYQASRKIHEAKPGMVISVAIFPDTVVALQRKHQNWERWLKNNWVDAVAPMTLTSAQEVIERDTKKLHYAFRQPVYTGVFGPFNGDTPTDIAKQVWSAVLGGGQGVILFEGAHITDQMLQALSAGLFKSTK